MATYAWDFGDGNTSTDPNPTHTYLAPGTYTVTLVYVDELGEHDVSHDIVVSECDIVVTTHCLTAAFTVEDFEGATYTWDFGDGTVLTPPPPPPPIDPPPAPPPPPPAPEDPPPAPPPPPPPPLPDPPPPPPDEDASMGIQAMIDGTPNGTASSPSTVRLTAGSNYMVNRKLSISGRSHLVFDLNGATIRRTQALPDDTPVIEVFNGVDIKVKNGTVMSIGDGTFRSAVQHNHLVSFRGVDSPVADSLYLRGAEGDGIYIGVGSGSTPTRNARLLNNNAVLSGRNPVSIVFCDGYEVTGGDYGDGGFAGFDVEPNDGCYAINGHVHDTVLGYGHALGYSIGLVANHGGAGGHSAIENALFERVTMRSGAPLSVYAPLGSGVPRTKNVTFDHVTSTQTGWYGSAGQFEAHDIDGLVVTNCTAHLSGSSATFVRAYDCTGISVPAPPTANYNTVTGGSVLVATPPSLPPPPTGTTATKNPWTFGTVDEGLPGGVAIYAARTLQPSGPLELQTMINALPGPGIIDISGQEVNVSSFSNPNLSGASGLRWRGLIGGISGGAFDNVVLVGHHVMASSIVSAIQAQQTRYATSQYAALRQANGTAPFYWMGVHMIGADQGTITESSGAQVSSIPARYKGVDFDLSGAGSIIQNCLFEGVNSASGSVPPWEVGALDFRRSNLQIFRRCEVSGIIPVGSKSRPNSTTVDPFNRGWKRSGGIQFNADKSPILTDVSLHDTLVSGLTFSIAGSSNAGSNNTEDIRGTRIYVENNANGHGFACINNEVVLAPVLYDHCTFKSPATNPHITLANNSGFGTIVPDIPTSQYQVLEPIWSGGGGGPMFHMLINMVAGGQSSYPKVVKNGVTLTPSLTTGKDPALYYYVQKV